MQLRSARSCSTEAIAFVLRQLPPSCPGMAIAQHIPPEFSRAFANRLSGTCAMTVKKAVDGDPLPGGTALIAPGDFHMLLRKTASGYFVNVKDGSPGLLSAPLSGRPVLFGGGSRRTQCGRRALHRNGRRRRAGTIEEAPGGRAHDRTGRGFLRGRR